MKAAIHKKYGPPEVVSIQEIPIPAAKESEVLVKVIASTVNRTDAGFRSAQYFISRFWSGLFKPKYNTLGCEFSGIIEKVGTAVSSFQIGDKVFGFNDQSFGGHGEYLCIDENDAVTFLPSNLSFEQGAALGEGANYAYMNIRAANIQARQHVMVYGATGAIGSAAIQLLNAIGAEVTAVCNTKNVALIQSLNPTKVIDYQTEDYTKTDQKFDFIFDAVGKSSFPICKPLLKEKGVYISTELGKNASNVWYALYTSFFKGKKVLFPIPKRKKADMIYFKELAESGKYLPLIDRYYHLDQIVEAYHYVESGQKTGNVVLKIASELV
jgi:NADPH:quinone reductase-like Zn-dependent oxidoreductase